MGHNLKKKNAKKSKSFRQIFFLTKYIENISENIVHQKYMHAILVGRKSYALDMPSNFIFTHRRWLFSGGGSAINRAT